MDRMFTFVEVRRGWPWECKLAGGRVKWSTVGDVIDVMILISVREADVRGTDFLLEY